VEVLALSGCEKTKPIKANFALPHRPKEWEKEKNRSVNQLMPDVEKNENIIFSSLQVGLLCYITITL